MRTARFVITSYTLTEMEDIVRIPITLGLKQGWIGTQPPISVPEISSRVTSRGVQVLSRDVSALDGPPNQLLLDVSEDVRTGHVGVRRVGAGEFDLEPSDVGQR